VVEAGDILAGEHSARRRFANGPDKNLTAASDVDTQCTPESRLPQTEHWRAESSRQSIQGLPVGDEPDEEFLAVGIYEHGAPRRDLHRHREVKLGRFGPAAARRRGPTRQLRTTCLNLEERIPGLSES
jgi:hypothetical protein